MLDFHTHILPGMDDGSVDAEMSCEMLNMLKNQGVTHFVATPHFYFDKTSMERFLKMREISKDMFLREIDKSNMKERPTFSLGAEVKFFYGMDRYEEIDKLCIEGTRYMLIEMPFSRWSADEYRALKKLKLTRDITPVIAHIDGYLPYNPLKEMMGNFIEADALVQVNTIYLRSHFTRLMAYRLLKEGCFQFLGSDCHDTDKRKPDYKETKDILIKKDNGKYLRDFKFWEDTFFKNNPVIY